MRRYLLAVGCALWAMGSLAQGNKNNQISADLNGGLAIMKFSDDEMVAPNRRHRTTVGNEITANIIYTMPLKKKEWQISAGLGYAERNFYVHKYSFLDFFLFIFPYPNPSRDSFKVQNIHLKSQYINVPVGFNFPLSKNAGQRVQFVAGLTLNGSFLVGKHAAIDFDETYLNPTPAERAQYERQYEETISGFTLGIQPRIDMSVAIAKGAGIQLGLFPFSFYANSWNKRIASNFLSFSSKIGVYYRW